MHPTSRRLWLQDCRACTHAAHCTPPEHLSNNTTRQHTPCPPLSGSRRPCQSSGGGRLSAHDARAAHHTRPFQLHWRRGSSRTLQVRKVRAGDQDDSEGLACSIRYFAAPTYCVMHQRDSPVLPLFLPSKSLLALASTDYHVPLAEPPARFRLDQQQRFTRRNRALHVPSSAGIMWCQPLLFEDHPSLARKCWSTHACEGFSVFRGQHGSTWSYCLLSSSSTAGVPGLSSTSAAGEWDPQEPCNGVYELTGG